MCAASKKEVSSRSVRGFELTDFHKSVFSDFIENDKFVCNPLKLKVSFEIAEMFDAGETEGITHYTIDVVNAATEEIIGKMTAWKLEEILIANMLHSLDYDSTTARFSDLFYDDGRFTDEAERAMADDEGFYEYFMILDRLEILPEYRGINLSKYVFELVENKLGRNSIIAMISFALQFEIGGNPIPVFGKEWNDKMDYQSLIRDNKKTQRRLTKYYQRLGYKIVKGCSENILIKRH